MNNIQNKVKNQNKNKRFAMLAELGEIVFHAHDLANLWNIQSKNTLHTTLSRYEKNGLLYRIYKGLYSIKDPKSIDPYLLGIKALHTYAYVSCESVLFVEGVINQKPNEITLVSKFSKRFVILGHRYRSRKMNDILLYNENGIKLQNGIRIADKDRAKRDLSYFNPKRYYDDTSK